MKHLTPLAALLAPTALLAHGGHAPVPEAAHGAVHAAPLVFVAVIAVLAGVWIWRRRS